jgi:hypothetical protein
MIEADGEFHIDLHSSMSIIALGLDLGGVF